MKMLYSELKNHFAEFHAGNMTKTELIAAIGLYQEMNQINAKPIKAERLVLVSKTRNKMVCKCEPLYIPINISPRVIAHRLDREEKERQEKEKWYNPHFGEETLFFSQALRPRQEPKK